MDAICQCRGLCIRKGTKPADRVQSSNQAFRIKILKTNKSNDESKTNRKKKTTLSKETGDASNAKKDVRRPQDLGNGKCLLTLCSFWLVPFHLQKSFDKLCPLYSLCYILLIFCVAATPPNILPAIFPKNIPSNIHSLGNHSPATSHLKSSLPTPTAVKGLHEAIVELELHPQISVFPSHLDGLGG